MLNAHFQPVSTKRFAVIEYIPSNKKHIIPVFVDFNCEYTKTTIYFAIQRRKCCKIVDTTILKDTLHLADFENINWESILNGNARGSSYIIRKGLSRKAQFALQIRRYMCKKSESVLKSAIPFTLVVDTWNAFENMKLEFGLGTYVSFENQTINYSFKQRLEWCLDDIKVAFDDPLRSDWVWILKPSVTNKGLNIEILRDWNTLLECLKNEPDTREWVLQRYISKPFLYYGHKFHFRVYILCVGALKVFVYNQILMLIAVQIYDENDLSDMFKHLTNTAKGAENENFIEENYVKLMDDLCDFICKERMDLIEKRRSMKQHHPSNKSNLEVANEIIEDMRHQIQLIVAELFTAFENEYSIFCPMSQCFEIFGLDFMIAEDLQVFLLEVNPGPDFKQTGGRLKRVIDELWEQTLRLVIDGGLLDDSRRPIGQMFEGIITPDMVLVYDKVLSISNLKSGMVLYDST